MQAIPTVVCDLRGDFRGGRMKFYTQKEFQKRGREKKRKKFKKGFLKKVFKNIF
jgi:hypothetical protein